MKPVDLAAVMHFAVQCFYEINYSIKIWMNQQLIAKCQSFPRK